MQRYFCPQVRSFCRVHQINHAIVPAVKIPHISRTKVGTVQMTWPCLWMIHPGHHAFLYLSRCSWASCTPVVQVQRGCTPSCPLPPPKRSQLFQPRNHSLLAPAVPVPCKPIARCSTKDVRQARLESCRVYDSRGSIHFQGGAIIFVKS